MACDPADSFLSCSGFYILLSPNREVTDRPILNKHGPIVNVEDSKQPFGNTRRLTSTCEVKNDANRAHTVVVPGGGAAKGPDGKFIHEEVWKYLFLHPVVETGEATPRIPLAKSRHRRSNRCRRAISCDAAAMPVNEHIIPLREWGLIYRATEEEPFMLRAIVCGLAFVGLTATTQAGELDREAAPGKGSVAAKSDGATKHVASAEMDRESLQQAHYWRGGWGYRPVFGWGGYSPAFAYGRFGFGGWGFSPGFYTYRSFGYGGWGYPTPFGGFGYGFGYPVGYGWYW